MKGYRIIEELGAGGYAKVHLAQRDGSGSLSVIKTLHEELTRDATARARFLREAQLGSLLLHENIARLTDAWFEGQSLSIASELIAGHNLEAIARRGPIPPKIGVSILMRTLAGLHHAHELVSPEGEHLGLVHRDLSPKNIVVGYRGEVKLIDFGVAHAPVGDFRTTPGMIIGTLRYLSPEQAVGDPIDRRSDIYSAGALLFELLAGRPLIEETDVRMIMRAVALGRPPPISPRLDPVIARATAKKPEDRHATALELAQAIREAAPDLARAGEAEIGSFVSSLFPREKMELERRIERAMSAEPATDATRVETRTRRWRIRWEAPALVIAGSLAAMALSLREEAPPAPTIMPPPGPKPSATPRAVPIDPVDGEIEVEAPPPRPVPPPVVRAPDRPAKARPSDPVIERLRARAKALAGADGAAILALGDEIEREASLLSDGSAAKAVQAKAYSSAIIGDLKGLSSAIDDLERARAR